MKPRRVTLLTHSFGWGGTEANTLGILTALAERGHDVTLVQLGHEIYDSALPASRRFASRHVALPRPIERLTVGWWRRLLRELRTDVCVLSKGAFDVRWPALDIAAFLGARRYVLLEHHPAELPPPRSKARHFGGLVPGLGLWWWRRHLESVMHLRLAHRVVTDSRHVTDILCEHYALPRRRTAHVHCGIDVSAFTFRETERVRLRESWGIPRDALVLGTVGRFAENKRLDRIVRAFRVLRDARPDLDAWLVLAGSGPERDAIAALAAELGLADRAVLPGYVEDAAAALSALDVYLLSSRAEGFGIAAVEAMACERVCVAMNSGGPGEILTDPALGWLTPAEDEPAFTAAVLAAAQATAEERSLMGRRARAHAVANFDGVRQSQRIAMLIESA